MTLSSPLNDKYYELSLIEDLVCLDIDDVSHQEELEHSPNPSLVPKYARLDYILTINQIIELVANHFGIDDGNNLVLMSIFKFDRGWRWCITIRDSVVLIGF